MSEILSPIRSFEAVSAVDSFRARLQETILQSRSSAAPAVTAPLRPRPQELNDAGVETALATVRTETQRGGDMAGAHSGLDPQRVAKLLELLG